MTDGGTESVIDTQAHAPTGGVEEEETGQEGTAPELPCAYLWADGSFQRDTLRGGYAVVKQCARGQRSAQARQCVANDAIEVELLAVLAALQLCRDEPGALIHTDQTWLVNALARADLDERTSTQREEKNAMRRRRAALVMEIAEGVAEPNVSLTVATSKNDERMREAHARAYAEMLAAPKSPVGKNNPPQGAPTLQHHGDGARGAGATPDTAPDCAPRAITRTRAPVAVRTRQEVHRLSDMVKRIDCGRVGIAPFRFPRGFNDAQTLLVTDCVARNIPIGALTLWRNATLDRAGPALPRAVQGATPSGEVDYVIDGYARLSALSFALHARTERAGEPHPQRGVSVHYDLEKQRCVLAPDAPPHRRASLLHLAATLDTEQFAKAMEQIETEGIDVAKRTRRAEAVVTRIADYQIATTRIEDVGIAEAAAIYHRMAGARR